MPSDEPVWLTSEALTEFNRRAVADTGEPFFVRDAGLLESALARPANRWAYGERDMARLAASLLTGLARNHPFGQGNKRTAFAAAEYFLYLNGYELALPDREEFADKVVDLITGAIAEEDFADLLADYARPL